MKISTLPFPPLVEERLNILICQENSKKFRLSSTFIVKLIQGMMSEEKKSNFKPAWNFEIEMNDPILYVESWFDHHPEPENIDVHTFEINESQVKNIKVYFADLILDTWLIKITCNNMRRSMMLSKTVRQTTDMMNITQILRGKELFLFTDRRF